MVMGRIRGGRDLTLLLVLLQRGEGPGDALEGLVGVLVGMLVEARTTGTAIRMGKGATLGPGIRMRTLRARNGIAVAPGLGMRLWLLRGVVFGRLCLWPFVPGVAASVTRRSLVAVIVLARHRLLVSPVHHGLLLVVRRLRHQQVVEPVVLQGVVGRDTELGAQLQHVLEEFNSGWVDLRQNIGEGLRRVHLPVGLVLGILRQTGPGPLGRRAHDAEDADELVLVGRSGEQGSACVHLGHDAPGRPDVDAGVVRPASEEDVGGAVPERHDLVAEGVDGNAKGAGEAEIAELELSLAVNQEVLRFEVSVQDAVLVAKVDAPKQLVHEGLDGPWIQGALVALGVHVLLEIAIHKLEHQHKFVLGVNNIVKRHNVFVFELLHKRDLADGRTRGAFFGIEMDLLEGDELARHAVAALEDLYAGEESVTGKREEGGEGLGWLP